MIRPDVTAEVAVAAIRGPPADLAELGVLRRRSASRLVGPGTRKPTSPALTVLTRSIVPKTRVPAPSTITSSGDQKTTISRRTARSAGVRS